MIADTEEKRAGVRRAGAALARSLAGVAEAVCSGVSAKELDDLAEELIRAEGAEPLFLDYDPGDAPYPFPASLCVSVNDEVVHGIPSKEKILRDGDVVSLDLGLLKDGYSADAAVTVCVGEAGSEARRLLEATRQALAAGIKAVRAGGVVGDIGAAVSQVAKEYRVAVEYDLGGHGTGRADFHEPPYIANVGVRGQGERLVEGMVLAIEPIFALGDGAIVMSDDGWTYRTRGGGLSAHFEHTIVVTKKGCEVVTALSA